MVANPAYSESIWAPHVVPSTYNRGLTKVVVFAQSQDELHRNLLFWALGPWSLSGLRKPLIVHLQWTSEDIARTRVGYAWFVAMVGFDV